MKAEIKELTRGCRLRGRPPSAEAAERIVEAATALFLGKGYGATTMQDVARRFGGSKQTIYARFPDKKALLEAVVTAFTERKLQTPRQLAAADGPADQMLRQLARAMLNAIMDRDSVMMLRLVISECQAAPDLAEMMERRWRRPGLEMVQLVMERLIAQGQLQGDAGFLARHFCESVLLPHAWDSLFEMGELTVTTDRLQVLDAAVDFFLSAAAPKDAVSRNCHVNTGPLAALDIFRSCYA